MTGMAIASKISTLNSGLERNSNNISLAQVNGSSETLTFYKELVCGNNLPISGLKGVSFNHIEKKGTFDTVENETSLGIEDKGFFVVTKTNDPADQDYYYTKDGFFTFDKEGFLKNTNGFYLRVIKINETNKSDIDNLGKNFNSRDLIAVNKNNFLSNLKETSEIDFNLNLPATPYNGANEFDEYIKTYDSMGNEHKLKFTFKQILDAESNPTNSWRLYVSGAESEGKMSITHDGNFLYNSTGLNSDGTIKIDNSKDAYFEIEFDQTGALKKIYSPMSPEIQTQYDAETKTIYDEQKRLSLQIDEIKKEYKLSSEKLSIAENNLQEAEKVKNEKEQALKNETDNVKNKINNNPDINIKITKDTEIEIIQEVRISAYSAFKKEITDNHPLVPLDTIEKELQVYLEFDPSDIKNWEGKEKSSITEAAQKYLDSLDQTNPNNKDLIDAIQAGINASETIDNTLQDVIPILEEVQTAEANLNIAQTEHEDAANAFNAAETKINTPIKQQMTQRTLVRDALVDGSDPLNIIENDVKITVDWAGDNTLNSEIKLNLGEVLKIDFAKGLKTSGAHKKGFLEQNGYPVGNDPNISIGTNGVMNISYNNNVTETYCKIPIATFNNINGLTNVSGNAYQESYDSGPLILTDGNIMSNTIEQSTVNTIRNIMEANTTQKTIGFLSKAYSKMNEVDESLLKAF